MADRIDLSADAGADLDVPFDWLEAPEGPWPDGWTASVVFAPNPGQVTLELATTGATAEGWLELEDNGVVHLHLEPEGLEAIGYRWTWYELEVHGPGDDDDHRLAEGLLKVRPTVRAE